MSVIRAYVDANVFKFAATELPRLVPRKQTITWGDRTHEIVVHDIVTVNLNDGIKNSELRREADLLPKLAELGKAKRLQYVINAETEFESWGLRDMDSAAGRFYNTPLERVDAPVRYGRVMIGGDMDPGQAQFRFLASLAHPRFLQLQKITGAYQGPDKLNRNQLLDAFHLWCAEHSECSFFLTLDFKLIRVLRRSKHKVRVNAVTPSELLAELGV